MPEQLFRDDDRNIAHMMVEKQPEAFRFDFDPARDLTEADWQRFLTELEDTRPRRDDDWYGHLEYWSNVVRDLYVLYPDRREALIEGNLEESLVYAAKEKMSSFGVMNSESDQDVAPTLEFMVNLKWLFPAAAQTVEFNEDAALSAIRHDLESKEESRLAILYLQIASLAYLISPDWLEKVGYKSDMAKSQVAAFQQERIAQRLYERTQQSINEVYMEAYSGQLRSLYLVKTLHPEIVEPALTATLFDGVMRVIMACRRKLTQGSVPTEIYYLRRLAACLRLLSIQEIVATKESITILPRSVEPDSTADHDLPSLRSY